MPHPDLARLMDYCLKRGQETLSRHGKIDPFSATVQAHGQLFPLIVPPDYQKLPLESLIAEHTYLLRDVAKRGEATAVALCFDNRAALDGLQRPNGNEIRLLLEHANGDSLDVQLRYHKRALMGYRFGALAAVKCENKYFFAT